MWPQTATANHWTAMRSEEHTSELQSQSNLVCRLLLEKKKTRHLGTHAAPKHQVLQPPVPAAAALRPPRRADDQSSSPHGDTCLARGDPGSPPPPIQRE